MGSDLKKHFSSVSVFLFPLSSTTSQLSEDLRGSGPEPAARYGRGPGDVLLLLLPGPKVNAVRGGADVNTSDCITAARLSLCVLFSSCSSVSGTGSRDAQWDAFLDEFPVTIGALAPSKEDAVAAVFGDERTRYFIWRRMQLEKRALHVSGRHRLCLCQTDTVCRL